MSSSVDNEVPVRLAVSYLGFACRVIHMLSISFLTGNIITNTISPPREDSAVGKVLFPVAGMSCIITGLLNWFLFKPNQIMHKKAAHVWIAVFLFKFTFTVLLLTPFLTLFGLPLVPFPIKTVVIIAMAIAATFMRFWREAAVAVFKAKVK